MGKICIKCFLEKSIELFRNSLNECKKLIIRVERNPNSEKTCTGNQVLLKDLQSILDSMEAEIGKNSIALLKSYQGTETRIFVKDGGRTGTFNYFPYGGDINNPSDCDEGMTIASTHRPGYYLRELPKSGKIYIDFWDVSLPDNTAAFTAMLKWANTDYLSPTESLNSRTAVIPAKDSNNGDRKYVLSNTEPLKIFCNMESDKDARIHFKGTAGTCFQIGLDELDVNDYPLASKTHPVTSIDSEVDLTAGGDGKGVGLIKIIYINDLPTGLTTGDFMEVTGSKFYQNNRVFNIHDIDVVNKVVRGYHAEIGSTLTDPLSQTIPDTSLNIKVRFRRSSEETVIPPTLSGATIMLPQIFHNDLGSSYPLFNSPHNSANGVVIKKVRSSVIYLSDLRYFGGRAAIFKGANSLTATEGCAYNYFILGRFIKNFVDISIAPSANLGTYTSSGASAGVIGQLGPGRGGYVNNNYFVGGNFNKPSAKVGSGYQGLGSVVAITATLTSGGTEVTAILEPTSIDINEVKVGYLIQMKSSSLAANNGTYRITSVDTGSFSVTFDHDEAVDAADINVSGDSTNFQLYYSKIPGMRVIEWLSNIARVVGRPDTNSFTNCAFEDRGDLCDYQIYMVGARKQNFQGCRFETGESSFPEDGSHPRFWMEAADENYFSPGTGLDKRSVTYSKNSSGNKFISGNTIEFDLAMSDGGREVVPGVFKLSNGVIQLPESKNADAPNKSLYFSLDNSKPVFKDASGNTKDLI